LREVEAVFVAMHSIVFLRIYDIMFLYIRISAKPCPQSIPTPASVTASRSASVARAVANQRQPKARRGGGSQRKNRRRKTHHKRFENVEKREIWRFRGSILQGLPDLMRSKKASPAKFWLRFRFAAKPRPGYRLLLGSKNKSISIGCSNT